MARAKRIEVVHGHKKAVFERKPEGWVPGWFYEGRRPMLRFKDHEWLSIGHVHPQAASSGTRLPGGGAKFQSVSLYGKTPVRWAIAVCPDPESDGFVIECSFTPKASIELLEAYSTFETPYEYEGRETVTTVIGMNPVSRWRGAERLAPPIHANPAWAYSRPQAVRITAPCSAPYLCQAITEAGDVADRFVTVIGDWNVCQVQDVYVTPTRDTPRGPASVFSGTGNVKGYKYIVGALNWSSAFAKDPNVLYEGGKTYRQRVIVDFSGKMPGGELDAMLLRAWERAALLDIPADGRVAAFDRATRRRVSWQKAVKWLRDAFCGDEVTEGLYEPGKGICTYAVGTRPKAGGDYSWFWWTQWAGPLHYRALMTDDEELEHTCLLNDQSFADYSSKVDYFGDQAIASKVSVLPSIWWIRGGGKGRVLYESLRPLLRATTERSAAENGKTRVFDSGAQASVAEALLLGAEAYGESAMRDQALVLLKEIGAKLDANFWEFNVGHTGSLVHGGQIRSLGHGHAILANLLAWRQTGDSAYLAFARRFARFLLSVSYACHNGSQDPDFDWRAWCNGSNAGRDQIAECPPWETQNGLLCITSLMTEAEMEAGFYDALWYIARTGLAQFPAARSLKRILDESMQVHYVPRKRIASERDFYDILPYLAYENPRDQTLVASYQGSDCILGEFVYGGGLARSSDDRLGILVPRAATMDLRELDERLIHVWNPTPKAIKAQITVTWPDGAKSVQPIKAPPRTVVRETVAKA
jgi:hypothetical protein